MPRDLFPQPTKETEKPELTTSPDTDEELKRRPALTSTGNSKKTQQEHEEDSDENLIRQFSGEVPTMNSTAAGSKRDKVHPYTQSLTLADIESCILLENATFPENERCTREKVSLGRAFPFLLLLPLVQPLPFRPSIDTLLACCTALVVFQA